MTTTRKPRPAYLTRAEAEAMIAEAVAVERARRETGKPLGIKTYPTFRKR